MGQTKVRGYEHGKNEWFSCDSGGDCHNAVDDCHSSPTAPYNSPPNTQVTNETACVHGFIHAHNRYCNHTEAREYPDMHISCPTTWKVQTFYFVGTTFANGTDIQQKAIGFPTMASSSRHSNSHHAVVYRLSGQHGRVQRVLRYQPLFLSSQHPFHL